MSTDINFEFEAPQFIDSWDKVIDVDDGADHFFDALDSLDNNIEGKNGMFRKENEGKGMECPMFSSEGADSNNDEVIPSQSSIFDEMFSSEALSEKKISQDVENIFAKSSSNKFDNKERRLSLKRKASPLKDRNEIVPTNLENPRQRILASKPVFQCLPTIAESPVLLTKNRVRPKPSPEKNPDSRFILRPIRKRNIGVCIKPLPKPPTIPEPFNLTEAGKHVHNCYEDNSNSEKENSHMPSTTPGKKPVKKKRSEISSVNSSSSVVTSSKAIPFSFYERDQEIMKRKMERMNGKHEECETKFEFKAKSPSVLRKEPFRPDVPGRLLDSAEPELSTKERAKQKKCQLSFGEKKMQELEENLFVFKAQPGPKGNSSFLSTASSSKKNFFNSSMASSIGTSSSDKSLAFSFFERDKELLKRREERMKQVETSKYEFKAKEPSVLAKEPFWPRIESRVIPEPTSPDLSTIKRAEERKKIEEKKRKAAARQKEIEEEMKKIHEEEIRKYRKTLEFRATSIKK